jgi:hypothetical protein
VRAAWYTSSSAFAAPRQDSRGVGREARAVNGLNVAQIPANAKKEAIKKTKKRRTEVKKRKT